MYPGFTDRATSFFYSAAEAKISRSEIRVRDTRRDREFHRETQAGSFPGFESQVITTAKRIKDVTEFRVILNLIGSHDPLTLKPFPNMDSVLTVRVEEYVTGAPGKHIFSIGFKYRPTGIRTPELGTEWGQLGTNPNIQMVGLLHEDHPFFAQLESAYQNTISLLGRSALQLGVEQRPAARTR